VADDAATHLNVKAKTPPRQGRRGRKKRGGRQVRETRLDPNQFEGTKKSTPVQGGRRFSAQYRREKRVSASVGKSIAAGGAEDASLEMVLNGGVKIPDGLQRFLAARDDYFVRLGVGSCGHAHSTVSVTVRAFLQEYLSQTFSRIQQTSQKKQHEVTVGDLLEQFNDALPKCLLYPSERLQLVKNDVATTESNTKQEDYAAVYGVEHLLRLVVALLMKIGDDLDHEIVEVLEDIVNEMDRNRHELLSISEDEQ